MLQEVVGTLRAKRKEFEVRVTAAPEHAMELAAAEGAHWPVVAAMGGDGTANEVANGLLGLAEPPPLALLPGGSVNAIAWFLDMPRDPEAIARLLSQPTVRRLDIGWADYLGRGGADGAPLSCSLEPVGTHA